MAERAGADHAMIERCSLAAALHDIGKLDIPNAILQKPGPLTPEETAVMQTHAPLGHRRLIDLGVTDELVLVVARHHHERFDGLGYPDGLKGHAIPAAARYFAVIDTFDALTSIRPYRRDVGQQAATNAIAELAAGAGSRYCPQAVEYFLGLWGSGEVQWVMQHFNDASALPPLAQVGGLGRNPSIVVRPPAAGAVSPSARRA
ncbi:MAG: HD domain-containing protein [Phycisphaerales bacterium]|nr:HD domain-containing protein [Phycisphaerales bacterium]